MKRSRSGRRSRGNRRRHSARWCLACRCRRGFFFFKQKTAYEMSLRDWSSDVCSSDLEYINVRHEQAAAFMADGLARVTDVPGVCLVTSGPGATNLLTGVAAAHVAHSPVVVLVGGVDLDHHGKDAFQDYDLVSMFRPVTKLAVQVPTPGRIPEMLRAALRAAMTGRRGPVFVEIPRNVLND